MNNYFLGIQYLHTVYVLGEDSVLLVELGGLLSQLPQLILTHLKGNLPCVPNFTANLL